MTLGFLVARKGLAGGNSRCLHLMDSFGDGAPSLWTWSSTVMTI